MSMLHIWPQEPVQRDGQITVSSVIEAPGQDRKTLWYSVPDSQEANLTTNADPFVIGVIYLLMQSGHDVHVHGEVSPSLLFNLGEFQSAWSAWLPMLKSVSIRADTEKEPVFTQPRNESVVAFSGGVDSCFTAYSQVHGPGRSHPCRLTAGVMVQGFDIPLDQPEVFDSAVKQSRDLMSSIGLELIPISTNYREVITDWNHSFGVATASCLALFPGRFRAGFVSQGLTYSEALVVIEGSNPLTEALLSSDSFRILPGGAAFTRAAKIFAMRDWSEFFRYLRVCWAGPRKDQNCCECEKCMRNILTFRALGLGLPPCFSKDVDDRMLATISLGAKTLREIRYGDLVDLARNNGIQGNWLDLLERRLVAARRFERTKNSKINRLYRWTRRQTKKVLIKLGLKKQS